MNDKMEFPNTFEEFLNEHSFKDSDEVYTNGCELIQTFRVMQGYEHFVKQIRADMLNEFTNYLANNSEIGNLTYLYKASYLLEQLKEKNNE